VSVCRNYQSQIYSEGVHTIWKPGRKRSATMTKYILIVMFMISLTFAQGAPTFLTAIKSGERDVEGIIGAYSIFASPDNKNVYVTGLYDSTLVVFNRDLSTGTLTYSACFRGGQKGMEGYSGAIAVAVSPDNKNVYVTGFKNKLAVFNRDVSTGALTFGKCFEDGQDGVDGLNSPIAIAVSPDNKNVFIAGVKDSALSVFNRDVSTGALSFSACFKNGHDGVAGLGQAMSVAVSPDNKNVYAVGFTDSALTVFDRDIPTGALSFSACFKDGHDGVEGLYGSYSVAVSPDNRNVYVAAQYDNALAVFNRDISSGALSFGGFFKNNQNGVKGLSQARSVMVSPDNKNVYVCGNNTLAVFNRDVSSGILSYTTYFVDGENGVDGLFCPGNVFVSPDNKNVYVTGLYDNAVAIFCAKATSIPSVEKNNPTKQNTYFSAVSCGRFYKIAFKTKTSGLRRISLLNSQGRLVRNILNDYCNAGDQAVTADFSTIESGMYLVSFTNMPENRAIKIKIPFQRFE
jgi:DNA-binding beta-propeller fold protein YncE